jgi:hypothetical protein
VLNCAGFRFDPSIFEQDCQPRMRHCNRLPLMDAGWQSDNQPGLYFAGTITQVRDYRKSSSAFIHGFRYNSRALFRMLESEHHGVAWPQRAVEGTPGEVTRAALERINTSSGLWQQFGYLADVISFDAHGSASYAEEIPLDYFRSNEALNSGDTLAITLEYGNTKLIDPFNQQGRVVRTDAGSAGDSAFLHPVIRHYRDGELQATHHVIEDLAAEWHEPEHVEPLQEFIQARLSRRAPLVSDIREIAGTKIAARRAS